MCARAIRVNHRVVRTAAVRFDEPAGSTGSTPLEEAAGGGFFDCCQLLLDFGANINHKNNEGKTPLHAAAMRPSALAALKLLVERGADVRSGEAMPSQHLLSLIAMCCR